MPTCQVPLLFRDGNLFAVGSKSKNQKVTISAGTDVDLIFSQESNTGVVDVTGRTIKLFMAQDDAHASIITPIAATIISATQYKITLTHALLAVIRGNFYFGVRDEETSDFRLMANGHIQVVGNPAELGSSNPPNAITDLAHGGTGTDLQDSVGLLYSNGDECETVDVGDGLELVGSPGSRQLNAVQSMGVYSALIGDGIASTFTISHVVHNLAENGNMLIAVYDAVTGRQEIPSSAINNSNGTVTLTFGSVLTSNSKRLILIGEKS